MGLLLLPLPLRATLFMALSNIYIQPRIQIRIATQNETHMQLPCSSSNVHKRTTVKTAIFFQPVRPANGRFLISNRPGVRNLFYY